VPTAIAAALAWVALAGSVHAQSLFIPQGQRAAEGVIGWSVGPSSNGLEALGSVSLDGRWDVGLGFNRYVFDLGGADDAVLTEWAPFARYFLFKETDDGTPVSLAVHGQLVVDRLAGTNGGWYLLAGSQLFKRLALDEGFAIYPFVGFSLVAESYELGGAPADRSLYLARQFGVAGQIALATHGWLRVTLEEQAFRRETYRAVRVTYGRRF
jgi:hypothetical protein